MTHIWFLGRNSIEEFLDEIFHTEEHSFRFIGDRCNEKWQGFIDVGGDCFKRFREVKWNVGSIRD